MANSDATDASAAERITTTFTIVREVPSRLTALAKTPAASAPAKAARHSQESQGALLRAFPPVMEGESLTHRQARMLAGQAAWSMFCQQAQDVVEQTSQATLKKVVEFAAGQHRSRAKSRGQARLLQRLVPTAVTFAGGVNAADHASTFTDLGNLLRTEGFYAAVLRPRDLGQGASIAGALQKVLRQFSGAQDAGGNDMQALLCWYNEQLDSRSPTGTPAKGRKLPSAAAEALASPLAKMGLTSPRPVRGGAAAALTSPLGRMQLSSPAGVQSQAASRAQRRLRREVKGSRVLFADSHADVQADAAIPEQAKPAQQEEIEAVIEASQGSSQAGIPQHDTAASAMELDPAHRPLVIVIEGTESVAPGLLQDLIFVLSEMQGQLPITLVLGLATSMSMLQQMLPAPAQDLLSVHPIRLVQAMERLEALVEGALLGRNAPGLMWGPQLLQWAHTHLLMHDFSTASLLKALQIAAIAHFQREPLSSVAAAAMHGTAGILQACSKLDVSILQHAVAQLRASGAHAPSPVSRPAAPHSKQKHTADEPPAEPQTTRMQLRGRGKAGQSALKAHSSTQHKGDSCDEATAAASPEAEEVAAATVGAMQAWSAWAACLHMLHAAALCIGKSAADGFSLRELYVEASCPGFLKDERELVDAVVSGLEQLPAAGIRSAASKMTAAADKAWQGEESLAHDLQALQALLPELQAAEDAAAAAEQQLQQQQEVPATDAKPLLASGRSTGGPAGRAFKSSTSRAQALQASIQVARAAEEAKAKAKQDNGLQIVARKLARILEQACRQHLATPPSQLPGAAALCCEAGRQERACLSMAPRHAIHVALAMPHVYLSGPAQLGVHRDMEDACIAYQLFLEYGDRIDVPKWFASFCQVYGRPMAGATQDAEEEPGDKEKTAAPRRKRGPRGSRKVFQGDLPSAGCKAEENPPKRRPGRPKKAKQQQQAGIAGATSAAEILEAAAHEEAAKEGSDADQPRVPMQELAVRFTEATKQLQLVGLLRPARKRTGNHAQKLVFQSGYVAEAEAEAEA